MTVIAVPEAPQIVCPSWCTVSQQDHVAELPAYDGLAIHRSGDIYEQKTPAVGLELLAWVDGTDYDNESTVVCFNEAAGHADGLSPDDARALALRVLELVGQVQR